MIPLDFISKWKRNVPWPKNDQVEQDLIICRALYQRSKGRDLFDLWFAFTSVSVQPERVVRCFLQYMAHEGHRVSWAELEQNLSEQLNDSEFVGDAGPLLIADSGFDFKAAATRFMNQLLPVIPGEPWQGSAQE